MIMHELVGVARRMQWTQGRYHLGLSDIPKLIALEADQTQK
jgi:hypothetical protein